MGRLISHLILYIGRESISRVASYTTWDKMISNCKFCDSELNQGLVSLSVVSFSGQDEPVVCVRHTVKVVTWHFFEYRYVFEM